MRLGLDFDIFGKSLILSLNFSLHFLISSILVIFREKRRKEGVKTGSEKQTLGPSRVPKKFKFSKDYSNSFYLLK